MQGRWCIGRLKFHTWSGSVLIVVLALVLSETLVVESQYYFTPQKNDDQQQQGPSRSQYYFYDDQSFFSPERARSFSAAGDDGDATAGHVAEVTSFSSYGVPEQSYGRREKRGATSMSNEEEDDEAEDDMSLPTISKTVPRGRPRPVKLPKGFNDRVNKRIKMSRKSKTRLHGDPDPIDDEDDEGRKPEARLLWPFSIEITKGQKDKGGWGGPGGYGSYDPHHPPPRTGLGFGFGVNNHKVGFDVKHGIPPKQFARIGFSKGRHPHGHNPHERTSFSVSGGYGPSNGWGWDAFIEHEKHRLKYEILKLKAKKKIAVLQNKVELKKLFSMLLQKKIQALEWW